jgi:hypothetical protein
MPSLVGGLAAGALFMGSGVLIQQVLQLSRHPCVGFICCGRAHLMAICPDAVGKKQEWSYVGPHNLGASRGRHGPACQQDREVHAGRARGNNRGPQRHVPGQQGFAMVGRVN